jgi:hypothetical protein
MRTQQALYKYKAVRAFLILVLSGFTYLSFSQATESIKVAGHFGGAITVTNNGISLIPNLTLGKPAAILDIKVGRRLTFEPQFRFALEGKPWAILFWWRYKLLESGKFNINIAAHPSLSFRNKFFIVDEVPKEVMTVYRYLAGDISPIYSISKNISTGIHFLHSYCLEKDAIKHTSMLAYRLNFTNIKLSERFYMCFYPQVYYLRMDKNDGLYFSSTLTIAIKDFPISVSSLISIPFQTTIQQDRNFIWNMSLTYTFNKEYVEK